MQCPFPGMDPYIERPSLWCDCHQALIIEVRAQIQARLQPKYAALGRQRFIEAEFYESYLDIIEPRADDRLITSIEILSPSNKTAGTGRDQYLQKQKEVLAAGANLVEIDLLRAGKPVFRISPQDLTSRLPAWHYLVGVSRRPSQQAIYPIHLGNSLPKIKIPLREKPRMSYSISRPRSPRRGKRAPIAWWWITTYLRRARSRLTMALGASKS